MNTETNKENESAVSVGLQLRAAREKLGLSQKDIADQLCLKRSTVSYIEDGINPDGLVPTFIRGYIRAYAQLVNLTLTDVLPPVQPEYVPDMSGELKATANIKGFNLGKASRKRESWIMPITWVIVISMAGLTGFWWWQNYNLDKDTIPNGTPNAVVSPSSNTTSSSPIALNMANGTATAAPTSTIPSAKNTSTSNPINLDNHQPIATTSPADSDGSLIMSELLQQKLPPLPKIQAKLNEQGQVRQQELLNTLFMTFTDNCWISVVDASGKTLFQGLKSNGQNLEVSGKPPYRVRLGVPSAVQIRFQGKDLDLSKVKKGSVLVVAAN